MALIIQDLSKDTFTHTAILLKAGFHQTQYSCVHIVTIVIKAWSRAVLYLLVNIRRLGTPLKFFWHAHQNSQLFQCIWFMTCIYMKNAAGPTDRCLLPSSCKAAPPDLFWLSKLYTQARKYCTPSTCHLFVVVLGRVSIYLECFFVRFSIFNVMNPCREELTLFILEHFAEYSKALIIYLL